MHNLPPLPSLEEAQRIAEEQGVGRPLTDEEMVLARAASRDNQRRHLQTTKWSEALCKRQFHSLGIFLSKNRSDLIFLRGKGPIRMSTGVDFRGVAAIKGTAQGAQRTVTVMVEAKGFTIDNDEHGGWPVNSLSKGQRQYLEENRQAGGLSIVHLSAWKRDGELVASFIISWLQWQHMEWELLQRAKGNYKGGSLRMPQDLDLIIHYAMLKQKGQWHPMEGHWLSGLLVPHGQPELL